MQREAAAQSLGLPGPGTPARAEPLRMRAHDEHDEEEEPAAHGDEEDEMEEEDGGELCANVTHANLQQKDNEGNDVAAYVEYTVHVTGAGGSRGGHSVRRRFNAFKQLHKMLSESLSQAEYPPSSAVSSLFDFSLATWFDTLDPDFVQQRQQWLKVYLAELTGIVLPTRR